MYIVFDMSEKYTQRLKELAEELVTPQRFGHLALEATLDGLSPDLPKAAIYYFPERTEPGDEAA